MRMAPDSWFNLPRKNGVAYAAQESWIQNATIRDNILFGSPFDEVRYRKVIKQCALKKDLESLKAGDQTEIGEKGLTLRFVIFNVRVYGRAHRSPSESGGQKVCTPAALHCLTV